MHKESWTMGKAERKRMFEKRSIAKKKKTLNEAEWHVIQIPKSQRK